MAARNVWRGGGLCSDLVRETCEKLVAQGRDVLDANLLAELSCTCKVDCSEDEALALLRSEYAKQQGRCRGGIMSGIKRQQLKRRASAATV